MVYDFIVFAMTAYKTFGALREPHMPIMQLLLRDGEFEASAVTSGARALIFCSYAGAIYFGYVGQRDMRALHSRHSCSGSIYRRSMFALNFANVLTYYVRMIAKPSGTWAD